MKSTATLYLAVQDKCNGSEFLNHHLLRFWKKVLQGVHLSRSRPYQKNDNRIVEQKNSSLVRKYLGYDRLDTVAQTQALNELYTKMGLYYNCFQPVMRLREKTWVPASDGQPARVQRRYGEAQTPFERLCATHAITEEHRQALTTLREQINPRKLRQEIYNAIDYIFSLPGAVPGKIENVFETLGLPSILQIGDNAPVTLSFDRTTSLR